MEFILFFGSFLAGLIGASSGLGGGVILMPLMVIFFGINPLNAIGASLLGVIVTSLGGSVHFLKKELVDLKTTALLETATVPGAIIGAFLATMIPEGILLVIFGIILLLSVIQKKAKTKDSHVKYPKHKTLGWIIMLIAGLFSGLLGMGSGALKVVAMDRVMKMPFKISTATSTFMIGVTAAASAATFYHLGYILPKITTPLVPGVLLGSLVGAKLVTTIKIKSLRLIFTVVIILLSAELIFEGLQRLLS